MGGFQEALAHFLDGYGGRKESSQPANRPVSTPGAAVSVAARCLVLLLWAICLVRITLQATTNMIGQPLVFNYRTPSIWPEEKNSETHHSTPRPYDVRAMRCNRVRRVCSIASAQVPMLVLNTTHQLTFFNADGPPIQKVTVTDVTGINADDFIR